MRRALVSSDQILEGKMFVRFVALICMSYIKKQMQVKGLDKLDVIECFEQPGKPARPDDWLQGAALDIFAKIANRKTALKSAANGKLPSSPKPRLLEA